MDLKDSLGLRQALGNAIDQLATVGERPVLIEQEVLERQRFAPRDLDGQRHVCSSRSGTCDRCCRWSGRSLPNECASMGGLHGVVCGGEAISGGAGGGASLIARGGP